MICQPQGISNAKPAPHPSGTQKGRTIFLPCQQSHLSPCGRGRCTAPGEGGGPLSDTKCQKQDATAAAPSPSHRSRGGPLPLPQGERESDREPMDREKAHAQTRNHPHPSGLTGGPTLGAACRSSWRKRQGVGRQLSAKSPRRVDPPVKPEGCGVGAAAGGGDNSGRHPSPSPLSFRDLIAESRSDLLKPCRGALDPAIKSRGDT